MAYPTSELEEKDFALKLVLEFTKAAPSLLDKIWDRRTTDVSKNIIETAEEIRAYLFPKK